MLDTGETDEYKTSLYTQNNSGSSGGCSSLYLQTVPQGCPRGVSCGYPEEGLTLGVSRNLPEDMTSRLSSNVFIFKSFI